MDAARRHPAADDRDGPAEAGALAVAGIAAVLASTCCVLPLALVLVGVGGAWMAQLRGLEPYADALIAVAVATLAFAGWRIFRRPADDAAACAPAAAACDDRRALLRRWFWAVLALTAVPVAVPLAAPYFYG